MWGQISINVKLAWITDLHYSIGFHKMGWDKIIDILDFYHLYRISIYLEPLWSSEWSSWSQTLHNRKFFLTWKYTEILQSVSITSCPSDKSWCVIKERCSLFSNIEHSKKMSSCFPAFHVRMRMFTSKRLSVSGFLVIDVL